MGGEKHYESRLNLLASSIIPQQFDFSDPIMEKFRTWAVTLFWFLCAWVPFQFVALFLTRNTLLPFWSFIEYMQLFSYIPLLKYNLMPYLYDLFRPLQTSHLILTDDVYVEGFKQYEDMYFSDQYKNSVLNVGKLG